MCVCVCVCVCVCAHMYMYISMFIYIYIYIYIYICTSIHSNNLTIAHLGKIIGQVQQRIHFIIFQRIKDFSM